MLQALIFDVDGTLADTEAAHRAAFNQAFDQEGLGWHWDEALYTQLLDVSGGKERLTHYWTQRHPEVRDVDGAGVRDTIARLHELKTAAYEAMVNDGAVSLRPGVLHLIDAAGHAGLHLAIATTTSPVNIAALLRGAIGPDWRQFLALWKMPLPPPSRSRTRRSICRRCSGCNCPPRSAWRLRTRPTACAQQPAPVWPR